jgi:hypothetical protein
MKDASLRRALLGCGGGEGLTPSALSGISPKYDLEIIYADSVSIVVGFGDDSASGSGGKCLESQN